MKALAKFALGNNYCKTNEKLVRYPKKSAPTFGRRERR